MKKLSIAVLPAAVMAFAAPALADEQPSQAQEDTKAQPAHEGMIPVTTDSAEARKAFEEGMVFMTNARADDARKAFERALEADPEFPLAQAALAGLQPPREAGPTMEKAVQASSDLPEAERTLIAALAAEMKGDLSEARTKADALVESAPKDWRARTLQAQLAMQADDWQQARAAGQKAAELAPDQGPPHNVVGYAHLHLGDTQKAIQSFQEYARLSPDQPNPQDSLGEAYLSANRPGEAEKAFMKAAEIDPGFQPAYLGAGQARQLQGQQERALQAFQQAVAKAQTPYAKRTALEWLAAHQHAFGEKEAARKTVQRLRELEGQDPTAPIFADVLDARMAALDGDYRRAVELAQRGEKRLASIEVPEMYGDAHRAMLLSVQSYAHRNLKQAEQAAGDAKAVDALAKKHSDQPWMTSTRAYADGEAAWAKGDAGKAAEAFSQCFDPFVWCRYNHAEALRSAGRAGEAKKVEQQLISRPVRAPDYVVVLDRLDRLQGSEEPVAE